MPVKPQFNPDYLYFITTTAKNHAHLFAQTWAKEIILNSFLFLRTSGRMNLYAFVIMPNHIHFIARFLADYTLSDAMRDLKRHTARQIISHFKTENNQDVLKRMWKTNNRLGQDYKVWEDGYDAREVFTLEFLEQKMDYLHNNPCQEHWKLSELPEDYLWSSARFYLKDEECIIPIDDVRELFA
jgi:REP element-mobilizing transposase RayT